MNHTMGTLTAYYPRLHEHCPHKLATSCRLISTPTCCACYDLRPHSRTYMVYIDGTGSVQGGTRWQGYSLFCKKFWTNRLAATEPPLQISQTKIPETPDQTRSLDRWFEFHQGYRLATSPDGNDQRVAVLGKPFREVRPGFLLRTLDQLRAGVVNDASRLENRLRRSRPPSVEQHEAPQHTFEEVFDALIEEASAEETPTTQEVEIPPIAALPGSEPLRPAQPLTRSEAALLRARERFARLFRTREDIQSDDYESPLTTLYSRAYDRYRQAEQRRADGTNTVPPSLDGLSRQERREIEEQILWDVMQESNSITDGLEEGVNAYSYRPADVSISGRGRVVQWTSFSPIDDDLEDLASTASNMHETMRRLHANHLRDHDDRMAFHPLPPSPSFPPERLRHAYEQHPSAEHVDVDEVARLEESRRRFGRSIPTPNPYNIGFQPVHPFEPRGQAPSAPPVTLDNQPDRPAPLTEEEMTKDLSCQVCYQQLANIVLLPCGHVCMCKWCANVVVPAKHEYIVEKNRKCPMCRKAVKQRYKIHIGAGDPVKSST